VSGHDIFVFGSSAGGLKALTAIVGALPADLRATLFVAQHISPDHLSYLPQILADTGRLRAVHPHDGETIRQGTIYVAPPDYHLLVNRGVVRVRRGPRENRFRPAIDALFRSAARAYGPRVIGVVLSGHLDDGTVGLQAVKSRGGITVVLDPREAEYPSMPANALRYAQVDHSLALAEIAPFLQRAIDMPAEPESSIGISQTIETEANIAEQQMNAEQLLAGVEAIGTRTVFTCPTCNGTLWQVGDDEPLRFRCHVGHAFVAEALLAEQTDALENALWSAIRLMEEKSAFARRLAERQRQADWPEAATRYEEYADNLDREVTVLRQLTLGGFATRYVLPAKVEE
jgi:two-component system, chemotaxis family, protein-glutamate methylesterase/glutaminase